MARGVRRLRARLGGRRRAEIPSRLATAAGEEGLQILLGDADLPAKAMDAELLLRDPAAHGLAADRQALGDLDQGQQPGPAVRGRDDG